MNFWYTKIITRFMFSRKIIWIGKKLYSWKYLRYPNANHLIISYIILFLNLHNFFLSFLQTDKMNWIIYETKTSLNSNRWYSKKKWCYSSTKECRAKNWNINQTFFIFTYVVWFLPHIAHIWCLPQNDICIQYHISIEEQKLENKIKCLAQIKIYILYIIYIENSWYGNDYDWNTNFIYIFFRSLQSLLSWNFTLSAIKLIM